MSHRFLKTAALALLFSSRLLTAQPEQKAIPHSFPLVIEDTKCQITVYQPSSPIVWDPLVKKESIPESQLLRVMMITNSDISVSLSDKDISKCFESKFDPEKLEELRATMKRRFETTGPTAADNPWKGMKYALDCVFIVEMDRRKFLIYQIFMPGGKINGHLYGQLNYVSGRWVVALLKKDPEKAFNISNPAVITDEFTKQKESSGLQALPLEVLLK